MPPKKGGKRHRCCVLCLRGCRCIKDSVISPNITTFFALSFLLYTAGGGYAIYLQNKTWQHFCALSDEIAYKGCTDKCLDGQDCANFCPSDRIMGCNTGNKDFNYCKHMSYKGAYKSRLLYELDEEWTVAVGDLACVKVVRSKKHIWKSIPLVRKLPDCLAVQCSALKNMFKCSTAGAQCGTVTLRKNCDLSFDSFARSALRPQILKLCDIRLDSGPDALEKAILDYIAPIIPATLPPPPVTTAVPVAPVRILSETYTPLGSNITKGYSAIEGLYPLEMDDHGIGEGDDYLDLADEHFLDDEDMEHVLEDDDFDLDEEDFADASEESDIVILNPSLLIHTTSLFTKIRI